MARPSPRKTRNAVARRLARAGYACVAREFLRGKRTSRGWCVSHCTRRWWGDSPGWRPDFRFATAVQQSEKGVGDGVAGWADENGDRLRNRLYPRLVKDTITCGACPRFHPGALSTVIDTSVIRSFLAKDRLKAELRTGSYPSIQDRRSTRTAKAIRRRDCRSHRPCL